MNEPQHLLPGENVDCWRIQTGTGGFRCEGCRLRFNDHLSPAWRRRHGHQVWYRLYGDQHFIVMSTILRQCHGTAVDCGLSLRRNINVDEAAARCESKNQRFDRCSSQSSPPKMNSSLLCDTASAAMYCYWHRQPSSAYDNFGWQKIVLARKPICHLCPNCGFRVDEERAFQCGASRRRWWATFGNQPGEDCILFRIVMSFQPTPANIPLHCT